MPSFLAFSSPQSIIDRPVAMNGFFGNIWKGVFIATSVILVVSERRHLILAKKPLFPF